MVKHGSVKKKTTKQQNRKYNLKRRYGITENEYAKMLSNQNGVCAICSYAPSNDKAHKLLVVDHEHSTGELRGLICHWCNSGLGHFKDSVLILQDAIRYLTNFNYLGIMKIRGNHEK